MNNIQACWRCQRLMDVFPEGGRCWSCLVEASYKIFGYSFYSTPYWGTEATTQRSPRKTK